MRRYKVVPPMYRRNRPVAGFPVFSARAGTKPPVNPQNAQSAADTLIGSLRRASLSPYVGMIQIRSRVKTMAVSSQPGNTDSPLFSSVYCTPLFRILQQSPTKKPAGSPAGLLTALPRWRSPGSRWPRQRPGSPGFSPVRPLPWTPGPRWQTPPALLPRTSRSRCTGSRRS